MNIVCVVVTHNSADIVVSLIDSLLNQSLQPKCIIIVDNASKDNTVSIINNHIHYPDILFVRCLEINTGGAGGFKEGLDLARKMKADYVVTFDDDVKILDQSYLQKLVKFVNEENLDIASSLVIDDSDYSHTAYNYKIDSGRTNKVDEIINNKAPLDRIKFFNGCIFRPHALSKLRGPRPEFFIRGDEQEFKLRVLSMGFKVGISKAARIYHPSSINEEVEFRGHKLSIIDDLGKQYFSTRNRIYLYSKRYGHNHSVVKTIRITFKMFYRYIRFYVSRKDYLGLYVWLRAFIDGLSGNLTSAFSKEIKQKYFE